MAHWEKRRKMAFGVRQPRFDKVAGNVGYNDKAHTYEKIDTGERYISVTTLIEQFAPKFDGEYWSTYKACKDVLDKAGIWWQYKKAAGGWEGVVEHFNKTAGAKMNPTQLHAIAGRKNWYLDSWEEIRDESAEKGSKIHEELEGAAYTAQKIRNEEVNYEVDQEDILSIQDFTTNRVYPELLIYNDDYMVSGQADKVFRENKYVDIHDYKTCKEINKEGFRGETFLAPLNHLPNANYWKFVMQLSTYGWMLEQCGYTVRSLVMHWIHGKNREDKERNAGVRTYKLPYLKEEVMSMMNAKRFQ